MMKGFVVALAIVASAGGVQAAGKKQVDCGHQAAVVAAIQQARLDRVKKKEVFAHVTTNATWPERYNGSIQRLSDWLYGGEGYSDRVTMRALRQQDYGAAWYQACLSQ